MFYNRTLAQMVRNFLDPGTGNVDPLDVVPLGGSQYATAAPTNGSSAQILPAPSAGKAWTLHSWGCIATGGLAATVLQFAALSDSVAGLSAYQVVWPASTTVALFSKELNGVVSVEPVSVFNNMGGTVTFFVRMAEITMPDIS